MKTREVVVYVKPDNNYFAILHWPGGVRFERKRTREECNEWLRGQKEELLRDFEIVSDNGLCWLAIGKIEPIETWGIGQKGDKNVEK